MTEEEAIKICKSIINDILGYTCFVGYTREEYNQAIKTLLEMYHKQKEENKKDIKGYSKMINSLEEQLAHKTKEIKELNLENQAFYEEMNCNDNEYISKKYSQLKENSISKAEILKALGYEENGEEYKRIYNKEELILSLIRTINEECDRLEDIEDQKTMLEIHNIENQRDKYWQDKIKDILKKYEKRPLEEGICFYKEIENLLEEQL